MDNSKVRLTGNVISLKDYIGKYEIYITTMHGDGGAYLKNRFYFSDVNDFHSEAMLLAHLFSENCPHRSDDKFEDYFAKAAIANNLVDNIEELGELRMLDYINDFLYQYLGKDYTNDNYYAAIDELHFYYYTSATKKEVVEIKIGDNYYPNFFYNKKIKFY